MIFGGSFSELAVRTKIRGNPEPYPARPDANLQLKLGFKSASLSESPCGSLDAFMPNGIDPQHRKQPNHGDAKHGSHGRSVAQGTKQDPIASSNTLYLTIELPN
jgi:hypothetical protein